MTTLEGGRINRIYMYGVILSVSLSLWSIEFFIRGDRVLPVESIVGVLGFGGGGHPMGGADMGHFGVLYSLRYLVLPF